MYCVFLENSEQQYISLIKGENMKKQNMFTKEYAWRGLMTAGGLLVIAITICIGAFLIYKGSGTFTIFGHSIFEFLGSTDWNPEDNAQGGGTVGALIFIVGSLCTCGLALLIATPFAVGSAIFMIEIAPKFGEKFYRPIVEIFAGIPSVVYGWVGLTVLIPFILCQKITVWQPTDWVLQDGSPFIKLSFRQQVQEFFQELFSDLREHSVRHLRLQW